MGVTLTFLGHAGALIEGSTRIAIDPFLTGNPNAAMNADEIDCEHIVLTHGHEDHVGDTVAIAKRTGATVYGAYELCGLLGEQGLEKLEPGNPGGAIRTPFGSVSFTQAFHSSSYKGRYTGQPCGVALKIDDRTVVHCGDTALFSDLKLIGELHRPDVALIPVGDRFTMGPAHGARAAELIGAPVAVPVHYATWPLLASDISAFAPRGVEVRALKPGESTTI